MTTDVEDGIVDAPADDAGEVEAPRPIRLFAHRVTGSSRQRLVDAFPCEIVESEPVDLIVTSTRMPLGQVSGAVAGFRRFADAPVVAVVHWGGYELATELIRAGAVGLVAEGNEAAVAGFVRGGAVDASLVETYDQRLGRRRLSDLGLSDRDAVTGLPGGGAFDAAIGEAAQSAEAPRVGFLRVLNYDDAVRRLSNEARDLLRRRLSSQLREIARLYGARLYVLTPTLFSYIAPDLPSDDARDLGRLLATATETFAPAGGRHLSLAVGHAGPEVTAEVAAIRELAQRAMNLAGTGTDSVVLSADDLSRTLAATTELEVLLGLVDAVEQGRPGAAGRGARVAELAGDLARHLGFDGIERSQMRLAAHLHEVGKVTLPADAVADPDTLDGDALADYRRYPVLGAEYLRVSGGPEVAIAVRHHQERWDGSGYPDGLAADDIPVGARIIAVAIAVEALGDLGRGGSAASRLAAALGDGADGRFDPTVVTAARALFAAPSS